MKYALLFAALPLWAVTVFEPSRDLNSFADWQAAVQDSQFQSFSQPISGFTVQSPYATFWQSYCEACAFRGQSVMFDIVNDTTQTNFVFDAPITAFGINVDAYGPSGPGSGLSVWADGQAIDPIANLYQWDANQFFGVVFDAPVTTISFVTPRDINGLPYAGSQESYEANGIWYQPEHLAANPEPAQWAELILVSASCSLLAVWRRRGAVLR